MRTKPGTLPLNVLKNKKTCKAINKIENDFNKGTLIPQTATGNESSIGYNGPWKVGNFPSFKNSNALNI
jgi:hypothetical protein